MIKLLTSRSASTAAVNGETQRRHNCLREQRGRQDPDTVSLILHGLEACAASLLRLSARRNGRAPCESVGGQSRLCGHQCLAERIDWRWIGARKYGPGIAQSIAVRFATAIMLTIFTNPLFLVAAMDPETESGETPKQYAVKVVNAILRGDKDLTPFPYVIVHWLRVTFPWLYYYLMERRADRLAARYRNTQAV